MVFQRSWLLVAVAAASLMSATSGCGGGGYTTDIYWTDSASGDSEPKKVRKIEEVDQAALTAEPLTQSPEAPSALVGVRHDLMLAPSPSRTARCSCLAVEVGDVQDKRFQWVAGAPEAGNGVMAVALSARGVTCEGGNADEEKRRPSISAVDQEGNDIVVEVEELPEGRPLASGAVIPRPAGGGAIYVKARKSTLPYARATAAGRCKVF